MQHAAILQTLSQAIDTNWNRQVAWLGDLIRFRSLRGEETACQDWLAQEFSARGWSVDNYTLDEIDFSDAQGAAPVADTDYRRATQIVAIVSEVKGEGRSLILQGHVDVVPEGPLDMWTSPPFDPVIRDGWMHGRGSCDMKAGISCLVFALDAIKAAGFAPAAPLYMQTVTEEESTGNGALSTILRGYRADAVLIPEPSGNTITRAHGGAIWFRLKVNGLPRHVANSDNGSNAIMATFRLLQTIEEHTVRLNEEAKHHPEFAQVANPIKFNPGIIRGGDWASSTAAWCEVDCRIGLLPGKSVVDAQKALVEAIEMAANADPFLADSPPKIEWSGFLADGYVLDPGSEAETCLAAAHDAVIGSDMTERRSSGVNDTRFYALYHGMTGLCYGPKGRRMHSFDEAVNLNSVKQTTLIIAKFIADWCGLRRI